MPRKTDNPFLAFAKEKLDRYHDMRTKSMEISNQLSQQLNVRPSGATPYNGEHHWKVGPYSIRTICPYWNGNNAIFMIFADDMSEWTIDDTPGDECYVAPSTVVKDVLDHIKSGKYQHLLIMGARINVNVALAYHQLFEISERLKRAMGLNDMVIEAMGQTRQFGWTILDWHIIPAEAPWNPAMYYLRVNPPEVLERTEGSSGWTYVYNLAIPPSEVVNDLEKTASNIVIKTSKDAINGSKESSRAKSQES